MPIPAAPPDPTFEDLIRYIQESRGVDFRGYKRTSLKRRVTCRMGQVGVGSFETYHSFLEAHPQEFAELLNTVLINVTSFFRDTDAWDALRDVAIPNIVKRANEEERPNIRVWSVGCASGEEPYSLAMLFAEALGPEAFARRIKIYGTDLDEAALIAARHAIYSPRQVEAVPKPLLGKYFEHSNGHYAVNRELRKCVIFGRHDVVRDAPISRIDLLVCRNLLIYLEAETQNQVLPRLHYALVDEGLMFLGKAETQLARSRLFQPLDLKRRIFRKVPQKWRRSPGGSFAFTSSPAQAMSPRSSPFHIRLLESLAETTATAYIAVDLESRLVFANLAARRTLEVGEADMGVPFQDLSISYRPTELRSRIEEVGRSMRPLRIEHQEYHRPPADPIRVSIDIIPLIGNEGRQFATLIGFSDTTRSYMLQQELEAAQESLETTIEELQSANEELETTNEELQSTNEELETTNEELQSSNEELETMNEELRSANEELESTNEELRHQQDEVADYRRYGDSILRSVELGVVVLDQDLKVRSWNRWNENAWGLRAAEVQGQAFLDLDIGLPVGRLRGDLHRVINAEMPHAATTVDALDRRGRHMFCRVRVSPLMLLRYAPSGLVLVIEDITQPAGDQDYTDYLGRIIGRSMNEVYFLDPSTLRFMLVNHGAEEKLGYSIQELRHLTITDLMPDVRAEMLHAVIKPVIAGEKAEIVFETKIRARNDREYRAEICIQHMPGEQPPFLLAIVHDTSERQQLMAAE